MANMNDDYEELIKAANALKTVKVDGNYWLTMLASTNSVLKVASDLLAMMQQTNAEGKAVQNAINNEA